MTSPQDRKIRLVLAEDNSLVRLLLSRAIETTDDIEVVAEASTGHEAVEAACRLKPDLVLMDISLPGLDGVAATRQIRELCPEVRVVGLSMHTDMAETMKKAGAIDCLDKGMPNNKLAEAIRACVVNSADC